MGCTTSHGSLDLPVPQSAHQPKGMVTVAPAYVTGFYWDKNNAEIMILADGWGYLNHQLSWAHPTCQAGSLLPTEVPPSGFPARPEA